MISRRKMCVCIETFFLLIIGVKLCVIIVIIKNKNAFCVLRLNKKLNEESIK